MIGKSHGTDRVGACVCGRVRVRVGWEGRGGVADWRISPTPRTSQITKESNGQLLTSREKICMVKNSDLGLENTAL